MEPNDQHPIDYLDSIATVPKGGKKGVSDKLFFSVIIGGILVALTVGALAIFNTGPSTKDDFARLSSKLQNLQSLADSSQKNIVSSDLRGINSILSLTLANSNRDIADSLTTLDIDPKKINPRIIDDENIDKTLENLEDARLNAIFDRAYAREVSYQLETLIVLLKQIESKTNNTSNKEFLSSTRESIKPLQEQFAEFSATTS